MSTGGTRLTAREEAICDYERRTMTLCLVLKLLTEFSPADINTHRRAGHRLLSIVVYRDIACS